MKICSWCNRPLDESLFGIRNRRGRQDITPACRACVADNARAARKENPEEVKEKERGRYANNPERVKRNNSKYRSSDRGRIVRNRRDRIRARERVETDVNFKLKSRLRTRLYLALKGQLKSSTTTSLLGCPIVWLEVHIESLFKPGMTWENYGPVWHVDHIKPCAFFDLADPEQQRICFHWTNLQPLFALDNLRKSDQYEPT